MRLWKWFSPRPDPRLTLNARHSELSSGTTLSVDGSSGGETASKAPSIYTSLKFITAIRTVYALLVLVYSLMYLLGTRSFQMTLGVWLLVGCIVEIFIFTIISCIALRKNRHVKLVTYLGMAHDSLLSAFIVVMTGMSSSPFLYLFLIVPLYGGITLQRTGGIVGAVNVSIVMSIVLYLLPRWEWLSPFVQYETRLAPHSLFYLVLAAFCVGFLTGYLSHLYAHVSHSLAQVDKAFAHLKGIYGLMLNALPIGIVVVDPQTHRVMYSNPSAGVLLGESLLIPERKSESAVHGNAPVRLSASMPKMPPVMRDSEQAPQQDVEWTVLHGEKYLHIAQFSLDVQTTHFVGYQITDLTAQYHADLERSRHQRLEHLGEFSAKVAHEIRNPLACISGCNEMLQMDAQTEEQRQIHEMMNGEIARLNSLLNDVLVFSRRPKLVPVLLGIKDIVESQRARFLESPCARNMTLDVDIDEKLTCEADETSFRQILMTLWQNACDATEGSGTIVVSAHENLKIFVSDSGPGIPTEALAHLFEPFYTTKSNGTGLGLATARQLAFDNGLELRWSVDRKAFVIEKR